MMGIQIRAVIIPLCVGELIAKSWGQVWFLYRNMDFFVFFYRGVPVLSTPRNFYSITP